MVASLSFITLTLSALSLVSARPVARQTQPEGYLEAYETYHDRYIKLNCSKQHHTSFFDNCCHPMLATESLSDRDPSCDPATASSSSVLSSTTTTAQATQTAVSNLGGNGNDDQSEQDDFDDCDEDEDEGEEDCDDEDDDESQAPPTSSAADAASSANGQQASSTSSTAEATSSANEQQAPPTSSTAEATSSTTEQQAPLTSTSTTEQQPTSTTEQQAPPTSTDTPPPTTTSTSQESQPTQTQGGQGDNGDLQKGGFATWFEQNNVAGACGAIHGDYDMIAAIDGERYGDLSQRSSLCGKQVSITNTNNGKSVTVTIADACPTCNNGNSIDLSKGAFQQIAGLDEGLVAIEWSFV